MANVIIIAGDTSTGKSTSLRNLDPAKTYINKSINKSLPWKGSSSMYSKDNKNTSFLYDSGMIIKLMDIIDKEQKHIETLVLDDVGFVMTNEFFERSAEGGYSKFSDIGKHMQILLQRAQNMRDDLNVVFLFHTDTEPNEQFGKDLKIKTIGKMLDEKYNPEAIVTVCLFTTIEYTAEGTATYKFITNRALIEGVKIPAKSPIGMFETLLIDNDLNEVIQQIKNYNN